MADKVPAETAARILMLEDSDIDAEMIEQHLARALASFDLVRVATRENFEAALAGGPYDIILSDYALPAFDGLTALSIAQAAAPQTPFILVSGVLGEEFATESLKQGATDYVLKQRLSRLPSSVTRALKEAHERQERQRAETRLYDSLEALRRNEDWLSLALEAGELGSWEYDIDSGAFRQSNRYYEILGKPTSAVPPDYGFLRDRVVPEDREVTDRVMNAQFLSRQPWRLEFRIRREEDGALRWIESRSQPVLDESGRATRLIGVVADITARKTAEEALEQRVAARTSELAEANAALKAQILEREKVEATLRQMQRLEAVGQLTSGVAHDFNNLLTVILGNIQFIEMEATDPKLKRRLDNVRLAAQRGATLTAQLLAFSRRQKLEPKPIDLNQTVAGMSDLLRSTMGGSVRLQTVLKPGLWPALVDPTQIELVILNLAINARDAMQVGGALTIETANIVLAEPPRRPEEPSPGHYVMVSVSDNGSGMSPEILAKVFEPFFTTKEVGKGSGLGLSQVLGFAKQSGGGVRIDTAVGQGSSIKVFLPQAASDWLPEPERPQDAQATEPVGYRAVILVVDDDAMVREITAAQLTDLGYQVVEAGSGLAALDALRSHARIDLLLVDFAMPGMNGAEVARRALEHRADLPVLFVTGYADFAALRQVGEDRVVQKPFQEDELAQKIGSALNQADEAKVVRLKPRQGS